MFGANVQDRARKIQIIEMELQKKTPRKQVTWCANRKQFVFTVNSLETSIPFQIIVINSRYSLSLLTTDVKNALNSRSNAILYAQVFETSKKWRL